MRCQATSRPAACTAADARTPLRGKTPSEMGVDEKRVCQRAGTQQARPALQRITLFTDAPKRLARVRGR